MVLVFKTTVDTHGKAKKLKPHLDKLPVPCQWNFDLADCDNILRIVGPENLSPIVIETLQMHGFECTELD